MKERMASQAAEVFDYPKMVTIYEDMDKKGKSTQDDLRALALAYKKLDRPIDAEGAYKRMVNMGPLPASDMLGYADVLRANGHYTEALTWYGNYAKTDPDDPRIKPYVEYTDMFMRLKRDSTRNEVRTVPINSPQADLGLAIMDDLLLFSSARGEGVGGKTKYKWDDQPFLNLYSALLKGQTASEPLVMRKDLNSRYHDGTASYDSTARRIYITRDNVLRGKITKADDGQLKLGIYFSDIVPGEWNQKEWDGLQP